MDCPFIKQGTFIPTATLIAFHVVDKEDLQFFVCLTFTVHCHISTHPYFLCSFNITRGVLRPQLHHGCQIHDSVPETMGCPCLLLPRTSFSRRCKRCDHNKSCSCRLLCSRSSGLAHRWARCQDACWVRQTVSSLYSRLTDASACFLVISKSPQIRMGTCSFGILRTNTSPIDNGLLFGSMVDQAAVQKMAP